MEAKTGSKKECFICQETVPYTGNFEFAFGSIRVTPDFPEDAYGPSLLSV